MDKPDYEQIAKHMRSILSNVLTELDKADWDCGTDSQCHILHDVEDALVKYNPILDRKVQN